MDMPRLTAAMAVRADQRGPAIEAGAVRLAVRMLARRRLYGPRRKAAGQRFSDCFDTLRSHAATMAKAGGAVESVPGAAAPC